MEAILLLCNISGSILTLYLCVLCFAGFLKRKPEEKATQRSPQRFAALIPARNEEATIGAIVESLLAQHYPRECFDVYVIPNNCTDGTATAAAKAGAKLLIPDRETSSKGEVLRFAFAKLAGKYDAYCIFDADNLVHPDFLKYANEARNAGFEVAQGFRESKNPHDNWIAGSMSVFYWFMCRFFNESRWRLGVSCQLNGTGFMVSDDLIRRIGWNSQTLTEDLEFTGQCALHGVRIGWMPKAVVYDEQPISFRDSCIQRRRWAAGSRQNMCLYSLKLLKKRTASSFDMACLFLANMLNYTGPVSMVLGAALYLSRNPLSDAEVLKLLAYGGSYLAALWIILSLAAWGLFRMQHRLERRSLSTILLFPVFMASWMVINLYASYTRIPKWTAVKHTRSLTMDELKRS